MPNIIITPTIAGNLAQPIIAVADGNAIAPRAIVTVPPTSMNQDYLSPSRKDDVRCPGEITTMQAKAIAEPM